MRWDNHERLSDGEGHAGLFDVLVTRLVDANGDVGLTNLLHLISIMYLIYEMITLISNLGGISSLRIALSLPLIDSRRTFALLLWLSQS